MLQGYLHQRESHLLRHRHVNQNFFSSSLLCSTTKEPGYWHNVRVLSFLHKITCKQKPAFKKALILGNFNRKYEWRYAEHIFLCAVSFFYRWFVCRLQARFKDFAPAVLSKPNRRTCFRKNRHIIRYTLRPNDTEYAHFSLSFFSRAMWTRVISFGNSKAE